MLKSNIKIEIIMKIDFREAKSIITKSKIPSIDFVINL
ncbi:hypothetical protein LCGC14_0779650 [marine sediment metagenome]|uniref:Uncharacterized protein n=1 Tax=marine sediment metagenome TaxID=412755 RepID=A0A0F9T321_9ZZZZ|nr:MAG: hypothetical protein Lokiarch_11450 [Candidatus Lokiarchaeum sp. GC14_75]